MKWVNGHGWELRLKTLDVTCHRANFVDGWLPRSMVVTAAWVVAVFCWPDEFAFGINQLRGLVQLTFGSNCDALLLESSVVTFYHQPGRL